jgi:hypothetical protein
VVWQSQTKSQLLGFSNDERAKRRMRGSTDVGDYLQERWIVVNIKNIVYIYQLFAAVKAQYPPSALPLIRPYRGTFSPQEAGRREGFDVRDISSHAASVTTTFNFRSLAKKDRVHLAGA